MLYPDSPIKDLGEDYLQQEKFVNRLKSVITDYNSQDSLTIQLRGEWGSGKSSVCRLPVQRIRSVSGCGQCTYNFGRRL